MKELEVITAFLSFFFSLFKMVFFYIILCHFKAFFFCYFVQLKRVFLLYFCIFTTNSLYGVFFIFDAPTDRLGYLILYSLANNLYAGRLLLQFLYTPLAEKIHLNHLSLSIKK